MQAACTSKIEIYHGSSNPNYSITPSFTWISQDSTRLNEVWGRFLLVGTKCLLEDEAGKQTEEQGGETPGEGCSAVMN